MNITRSVVTFLVIAAALAAQNREEVITDARVRDAVSFLASDELLGRDSPSPGLNTAANWLAERFAKAGLVPATKDTWLQKYVLPGVTYDASAVKVSVRVQFGDKADKKEPAKELQPGTEVRLFRLGDQASSKEQAKEDAAATVALYGDPRVERLLMSMGSQRPLLLEVDTDNPHWRLSAGVQQSMARVRKGSRPVFLVAKGALPGGPFDDKFEERHYSVEYEVPAPKTLDVELPNVVAVLPGASKPDEYVVVSAHFDHIGVGPAIDGDSIYNGADDDASGTTAVLLLAESLAKMPRLQRSVAFVCFSAEEKGLLGSNAFAEHPPFALDKMVANINIEMIGRPEEGKQKKAWITGKEYSDFAAISGPALARAGIELVDFNLAKMLFAQSDNYSLARAGVVAHSISAGSLHADYHKPSDEVKKLDIPHMTAVILGLREMVVEFANRPAPPAYNDEGKKELQRVGRRR
jgi:hypothetical protein